MDIAYRDKKVVSVFVKFFGTLLELHLTGGRIESGAQANLDLLPERQESYEQKCLS
jgi:hypothetical protein